MAELSSEKEQLKGDAARLIGGLERQRELANPTIKDLIEVLSDDIAVIDLVHLGLWTHSQGSRGPITPKCHYVAFVLRSDVDSEGAEVAWVDLGSIKPIVAAVARWRAEIAGSQGASHESQPPDQVLREIVWDKIEPYLAGCSTVIIVPDDTLGFVPWAALPGRRPDTRLVEDYAIATVSSGQQLYELLTEPAVPTDSALLVGGVDYDGAPGSVASEPMLLAQRTRRPAMKAKLTWPPLPGTIDEVDTIERLKPPVSTVSTLRGIEANEAALRRSLPSCRYVHLATHGFFADPQFRSLWDHDVDNGVLFDIPTEVVSGDRLRVTADVAVRIGEWPGCFGFVPVMQRHEL